MISLNIENFMTMEGGISHEGCCLNDNINDRLYYSSKHISSWVFVNLCVQGVFIGVWLV